MKKTDDGGLADQQGPSPETKRGVPTKATKGRDRKKKEKGGKKSGLADSRGPRLERKERRPAPRIEFPGEGYRGQVRRSFRQKGFTMCRSKGRGRGFSLARKKNSPTPYLMRKVRADQKKTGKKICSRQAGGVAGKSCRKNCTIEKAFRGGGGGKITFGAVGL